MKLLTQVLLPSDRDHLRKILDSSVSTTQAGLATRAKAHRFLQQRTYVEETSVLSFQALPEFERERLLSELVWRLTCYVDGSDPATDGIDLGGGCAVVQKNLADGICFCLRMV